MLWAGWGGRTRTACWWAATRGGPRTPVRWSSAQGRLGLSARLRLAGHCEDMPAALMLADVVVSASLKPEPFGRSVIEAQAMGRPVVAFDHGGAAETVQHRRTGLLVPPGDVAGLADAIGAALDLSPGEREALGGQARDAVLAGFTTAAMQAATLAVYAEVLAAGGRR